ncbi:MAG: T9SS type A sorting domain-containing protein [Saprospiraceae bacterium]|nr:T9SS type A sorting domain-containing protein [Saprospiraceae bacterium]
MKVRVWSRELLNLLKQRNQKYINPVTNTLYVKDVQGRAVEILSIEGTILYSVNNFQAERIDVSTLKNGIYILKVSGVDHVSTFKFIKIE